MGKLPSKIHVSWHPYLSHALETDVMRHLNYVILNNCTYYPKAEDIFNVFTMPIMEIRVVILGQDPYPQPNQAIGYAFAVHETIPAPKSLQIIHKEIWDTCYKDSFPVTENYPSLDEWKTLQHWRDQGVFLLNTALTVEHGKAGSHSHYWDDFIKHIIKTISATVNPAWLLWGLHAQRYESIIKSVNAPNSKDILKAPHPAAEVYSNGKAGFYGSNHFQKVNQLLVNNQINW